MREFVLRVRTDRPDVYGARWWNGSFVEFVRGNQRRQFLGKVGNAAIGWGLLGLGIYTCNRGGCGPDEPESTVSLDAIELQRREGWNAGYSDRKLPAVGRVPLDAGGTAGWQSDLRSLASTLQPEPRLQPFSVPTLFQSLADPQNESLRQAITPEHGPDMEAAQSRGKALFDLANQSESPSDLAIIVDLPGPQSVALAAALAPSFCPVFVFDNWPHPLGVVPSQDTLGAVLYYLPVFRYAAHGRMAPSRPLFVLDANRLAPYRDAATQFDNRYVAALPSAERLQALGVRRLLYVRPDRYSLTELDDLNDDFVAYQRQGLEVRALALDDFTATGSPAQPVYYYGGSSHVHSYFWRSYAWSHLATPRTVVVPRTSPALDYRPVSRPTIFASRTLGGAAGIGKQKPSGFGRVSVRMSGGEVSAYGSSIRRSGSFGRSRSSSFG